MKLAIGKNPSYELLNEANQNKHLDVSSFLK